MLHLPKKQYQTLNTVAVSKSALEHNHRVIQSYHFEAKVIPVLKSNAYGHGLKPVAQIFDCLGAPFLAVDSLFEAYELLKLHVKTPILILGYTNPINFTVKRLPFHIALFDLEVARCLNKYQKNCSVHIFVDTGMCREGITISELPHFISELRKLANLNIVGLCSHLADADNPTDSSFSKKQLENYRVALNILKSENTYPKYRHISASAGSFKIKDPMFNMIRAGLASYGINPLQADDVDFHKLALKPCLEFTSTLAQIKKVPKGSKIGYNGTYTANKDMTLGLLPLGYYEGLDRRLSSRGMVTIQDMPCPIVGRVSMNMTTIDLGLVNNPRVGDQVTVYSTQPEQPNSLINAAETAKTIPYELLTHISETVKRVLR